MTAVKIPYLELFPAAGTEIMDEESVDQAVGWLLTALFALAKQQPSEVFTLLTTAIEDFADRTDNPADTLGLAIETLALTRREILGVPEEVTSG